MSVSLWIRGGGGALVALVLLVSGERVRVLIGDCRERLRDLEVESVQTVVTSPPYFALRDYGEAGQLGLEPTPKAYVSALVRVFREVRRVLRADGTVWLNLGDSYSHSGHGPDGRGGPKRPAQEHTPKRRTSADVPPKSLLGIPWRVALALAVDGWTLRSDIIWHKPNPMPSPVLDRPTNAHEYLFLFAKSERYYYDADSVREPFANGIEGATPWGSNDRERNRGGRADGFTSGTGTDWTPTKSGRNRRSVWTIPVARYEGAHFATFPPALIEPCVLAGAPPRGVVLDPFAGTGTTAEVSLRLGRDAIAIELSPKYGQLIERRLSGLQLGGLAGVA